MTAEVQRFGDLPVSSWQNGAGRKADIAASSDWHVGFAWLDRDAAFSDFTGRDRTITLVDGAGFTLEFPNQPALRVDEPYCPKPFDGGWPARCVLLGGPSMVLNAMTLRGRCRHRVTMLPTGASVRIDPGDAEAIFLVLLAGQATLSDGAELRPRDAMRVGEPFTFDPPPGTLACTVAIERHR